MSKKKKIGVVLIVLQMLGFIGQLSNNTVPFDSLFSLIGFCIPGILGIYLIVSDNDKPDKTNKKNNKPKEKKRKGKIIY